jgi:hypothetical protein
MLAQGTVSPEDLRFIRRVETAEEVIGVIREAGLLPAPRPTVEGT